MFFSCFLLQPVEQLRASEIKLTNHDRLTDCFSLVAEDVLKFFLEDQNDMQGRTAFFRESKSKLISYFALLNDHS